MFGQLGHPLGTIVLGFINTGLLYNEIVFSQTVRGFNGTKFLSQSLTLTQQVLDQLVYQRSVSNSLNFLNTTSAERITKTSNSLTFSQATTTNVTTLAANNYSPTETLDLTWTHSDFPNNVLGLTQIIVVGAFRSYSLVETITYNQTAVALRIRSYSASNVFNVSQNAVPSYTISVSNTFVPSGVVSSVRTGFPQASNILILSQSVTYTGTYNLTPNNQLVFNDVYQQQTTIDGLSYPIPQVMITKVNNLLTIQTKKQAIVVRAPLFNDSEGGLCQLQMKRTITAGTWTYKRTTRNRLLEYNFELDRNKTRELREFVLLNLSTQLTMTNWKGEIWVGYFTSNPIEMTGLRRGAPAGDTYGVKLEFTGVMIHG